jgi:hypothetical protein
MHAAPPTRHPPPHAVRALASFPSFLRSGGFAGDQFGAYQAGEMLGAAIVAAVPAALVLWCLSRRRLVALRIAAIVWVLLALRSPQTLPLAVAAIVLALLPSTRAYCRGPGASTAAT